MKKLFAVLTVMAMVISTTGVSFAQAPAFTDPREFTAIVTVGGTPGFVTGADFDADLLNVSNNAAATQMVWATSAPVGGEDHWVMADQYIRVVGYYLTTADWGIQIYTDNANNTVPFAGSGDPAGMISSDGNRRIPMCWRTKVGYYQIATSTVDNPGSTAISAEEKGINEGVYIDGSSSYTVLYDSVDAVNNTTGAIGADGVLDHAPAPVGIFPYYAWRFLADKNSPDMFANTYNDEDACLIYNGDYKHAAGADLNLATISDPRDNYYCYFGANFFVAVPQVQYRTDTLTVEFYRY